MTIIKAPFKEVSATLSWTVGTIGETVDYNITGLYAGLPGTFGAIVEFWTGSPTFPVECEVLFDGVLVETISVPYTGPIANIIISTVGAPSIITLRSKAAEVVGWKIYTYYSSQLIPAGSSAARRKKIYLANY